MNQPAIRRFPDVRQTEWHSPGVLGLQEIFPTAVWVGVTVYRQHPHAALLCVEFPSGRIEKWQLERSTRVITLTRTD